MDAGKANIPVSGGEDDQENESNEVNAAFQQLNIANDGTEERHTEEGEEIEDGRLERSVINLFDIIWTLLKYPELHTVIFWWACLHNICDFGEIMLDLGVDMHSADEYSTCGLHLVCSEYSKLSPTTSIPSEDILPADPEWFYAYNYPQGYLLDALVHAGVNVNQKDKFHRIALTLVSMDESTTNPIPNLLLAGASMNRFAF